MENKTLTLGSLFDGSGSFPLGGLIAGITPVFASEVEPYPIRVTTKRFPEMKHYGDISVLNGAELPPVDIITFGSPCFPAGTLVLTDKGYLPIEEVKVGMKALTHMGRWRRVTDIGAKFGETVIVKGNHYGLECTPNHPIYSAEMRKYYPQLGNGKRGNMRLISKEKKWTAAEKMQGKLWAIPHSFEPLPIPRPHHDGTPKLKDLPEFDEDFFYLVGRWLGDGWVRNGQRYGRPNGQRGGTIVICAGYDKEEKLKAAIEAVVDNYCVERCRTAVKYKFTSLLLCEWLVENFGRYAHGKGIPSWAFSMPEHWRRSLLQGILDTDGHRSSETTFRVTTVSKKLAHGIRLLGETLGYSSTAFHVKMPPTCQIEGRTCNQRDQYVAQITASTNRSRLSDELHSWYKVRAVQKTGEEKLVYNMTVDEDNSYVADGIVVHNCQDMSVAGKRSGLDGSRSSLFYEAIRIIKEMRGATDGKYPRYIVWENVPGAFSSSKGQDFRCVLEEVCKVKDPEVSVPFPGKWESAGRIMGDGYSVAWRQFDAQFWGVPQRRKRIYLVADFAGGSAGKILFESEGLSGYTPQGFRSWETAAGTSEEGTGETGCYSVDGYNSSVDDVASTLGVNCGVSTGRNGVMVLNDQGGNRMDVTEDMTTTLRAEAHHPPVVLDEPNAAGFCTEHSAKSRSIGYEEELSPTLRVGAIPAAVAKDVIPLEYHPTDSRIGIEKGDAIQTLTSRMGTGGNNVPMLLKLREGRSGGGKGPLLQEDKSATLSCNNDQTLFQPKAYGICSKASNSMMSNNPHSGFYEADTSRTLDVKGGDPACNQGGIAVVAIEGNGSRPSHHGDGFRESDTMYTLNATEQHAVAFADIHASLSANDGPKGPSSQMLGNPEENFVGEPPFSKEPSLIYTTSKNSYHIEADVNIASTLVATDYKDPPTVTREPDYIVRRLTPTECARLQGFPDWWCSGLETAEPTQEDIAYWTEVFETHRKLMGTSSKPKTESQIIKWLQDPHSDSAEYKMWGNGCALPNVVFVLSGIVWAVNKL